MINIQDVEFNGTYTATVEGNDGEEELVIMLSMTQALKTAIMVVAVSIDGGMKVLADKSAPEDWVPIDGVPVFLAVTINEWANSGIAPNNEQAAQIKAKAISVVNSIMVETMMADLIDASVFK